MILTCYYHYTQVAKAHMDIHASKFVLVLKMCVFVLCHSFNMRWQGNNLVF